MPEASQFMYGSSHILTYQRAIFFWIRAQQPTEAAKHCRKLLGEQRDHKKDSASFSSNSNLRTRKLKPVPPISGHRLVGVSRCHAVIYNGSTNALLTNASVVGSCLRLNGKKWIPEILQHLAKTTLTTAKFQPLSLSIVDKSG